MYTYSTDMYVSDIEQMLHSTVFWLILVIVRYIIDKYVSILVVYGALSSQM